MTISAIGASSASWMPQPPKPPALTSTASLLGMSANELRQAPHPAKDPLWPDL